MGHASRMALQAVGRASKSDGFVEVGGMIAHFATQTSVAPSDDDYGSVWWGWSGMTHSFSLWLIWSGCGGFDADGFTSVEAIDALYRAAQ